MSHKKHDCSLHIDSGSILQSLTTWTGLCSELRAMCLISQHHPATYLHFRSYPTVIAERQRHLNLAPNIIHPLSNFSLAWNSMMALVNIAHMILSSLRLCYIVPNNSIPELHAGDHTLLALHMICWIDLALKFRTGYLEGKFNVSLNKSLIACHYLRSWFLVDFISSLPVSYGLLLFRTSNMKYLLIGHLLPNLKVLRIGTVIRNIVTFTKVFNTSYIYYGAVRNTILFLVSLHWCSCFIYIAPIFSYYWTGKLDIQYKSFLNSTEITNHSISRKYKRGIFICLSAFMGTGHTMLKRLEYFDHMIHTFLFSYAGLFMIYTLVFLIKVYFTKYHSEIRYSELMNQLKEYMQHKQFPAPLKKRVIAFYYYTYQGNYFREDTTFNTLSDHLRNEVILHTCQKLVNKVELFDGLPASVIGSVLGCLRAEVYMPNDLVVRAGDIGDCMYFIANGTVAVYSLKGVEVCHLEDGAYFGEVALLMKDSKRVATVVAVEITQVYRLDAEDFRNFLMSYQVLYERIEILASQRMHETVLVDEAFRRNKEHLQEQTN